MAIDKLNSAQNLGSWICSELASVDVDTVHITRVITQELDRWVKAGLTDDEVTQLTRDPADTGDDRWDALIEGLVARHLHLRELPAPAWTSRTQLPDDERGWSPALEA